MNTVASTQQESTAPVTQNDFPHITKIQTRWSDNDMLGHINNVAYYRYIEAIVVDFMIEEGGLDWVNSSVVPYAAESSCRFIKGLSFPEKVVGGLKVVKIGRTSVIYELALFGERNPGPAATGRFVHVFVDRDTEVPVPIPDDMRELFNRFLVEE